MESPSAVTVGDFVLFTGAVAAIQTSAVSLMNLHGEMALTMPMFKHYQDFVETAPSRQELRTSEIPALRDGITFDRVWFRYTESSEWVLRDLSLRIPAGATLGLVGPNGEGKSTIIRLLLRFNTPSQGRILWDGVDIETFEATQYRRQVTGVLQDRPRYELDVHENISLGRIDEPQVACEESNLAVNRTGLMQLVQRLPHGMATLLSSQRQDHLGRNGITLSGGQWDRLALARAEFRDAGVERPQLVVLDEPNAGLDPHSEARLIADLASFHKGATRIVVSHRLSMVRAVDWVAVLGGGAISEFGQPEDLLRTGGAFSEIFTLQAAAYQGSGTTDANG